MRVITPEVRTAVSQEIVHLAFFVELEFEETPVRFWTGIGTIVWDSKTWIGAGSLLKLSLPEETRDFEAKNAVLELAATPEMKALALDYEDGWQGFPARIWLATMRSWTDPITNMIVDTDGLTLLDTEGNPILDTTEIQLLSEIIANPIRWFKGTMDQMPIVLDPEKPIIRLFIESDGILFTQAKERRYTHEDQQIEYEGDKFFEFVPDLQDKEILLE